jgi:hypothetical protein
VKIQRKKRLLFCFVVFLSVGCSSESGSIDEYKPVPKKEFKLPVDHTVVVAVLDSPLPDDKNVVWCSTLQIAWNNMKNNIIGEDIQVIGAQALADKLNQAPQSSADLAPESYFAAAGYGPAIVQQIQRGMQQKFPTRTPYDFGDVFPTDIITYAYLIAEINFTKPYFENDGKLIFTDANGQQTAVTSFYTYSPDPSARKKLIKQIGVLYVKPDPERPFIATEFALDLDNKSNPYQIVAAMIKPQATLAEALASLDDKIYRFAQEGQSHEFSEYDSLIIPNIHYKVSKHFSDLIEKSLGNKDFTNYFFREVFQDIEFRLDRSGAVVESETALKAAADIATDFIFNKPFLIYMKKRDTEHPCFVMWVGNAALLDGFVE